MMEFRCIAAAALLPLAACSTMDGGAEPAPMPTAPSAGECNADGIQSLVGQIATAAVGAQLLKGSGATTLRWVPPRTAVTMDFRPDRLTVSYDGAMKIERVSCG